MHNSVPLGRALRRAAGSGRGVLTLSWSASTTRSVDPDAPAASRPSHTWRRLPELGCANHTPIPSSRTRARKADAHASGGGASSGCGRPIGGFHVSPRRHHHNNSPARREGADEALVASDANPGPQRRTPAGEMLTLAQKNKIRGMLADKQSAKTIAEEFGITEADVQALSKPKAVRTDPRAVPLALSRAIARVPRPGGPDCRPQGRDARARRRACAPRVVLAACAPWPARRAAPAPPPSSGRRAQSDCAARRR